MALPLWITNLFAGGIGETIKSIGGVIDDLHTSAEEKLQLKAKFTEMYITFASMALQYEAKLAEIRGKIIQAEAQSSSFLTSNWRPITMLTFLGIIVASWFGYRAPNITDAILIKILGLIEVGLTGYVVGRSAEKIVPAVLNALKKKEEV